MRLPAALRMSLIALAAIVSAGLTAACFPATAGGLPTSTDTWAVLEHDSSLPGDPDILRDGGTDPASSSAKSGLQPWGDGDEELHDALIPRGGVAWDACGSRFDSRGTSWLAAVCPFLIPFETGPPAA